MCRRMEGDKQQQRSEKNDKTTMECDDNANANSASLAGLEYTEASLLTNIHSEMN